MEFQIIHPDQGCQFVSDLFKELCDLLGMKKTRTRSSHPSGNPVVERFNRTLTSMLAAQREWDRFPPFLIWATTPHLTAARNLLLIRYCTAFHLDSPGFVPSSCARRIEQEWTVGTCKERFRTRFISAWEELNRCAIDTTTIRIGQLLMLNAKVLRQGQFISAWGGNGQGPTVFWNGLALFTDAISK